MKVISESSKSLMRSRFLSHCTRGEKGPVIYSMAGIPAAGKTTFVKSAITQGSFPENAFMLNPDIVMEQLPEYLEDLVAHGKEHSFTQWEIPSRELAFEMLEKALAFNLDIIKDMGCVRPENIELLARLKSEGYKVRVFYIHCNPEEAILRAQDRDRHFPENEIYARFDSLTHLLPELQALADEFSQFDNSDLSSPFRVRDKI